jgi:hypothetical protein
MTIAVAAGGLKEEDLTASYHSDLTLDGLIDEASALS